MRQPCLPRGYFRPGNSEGDVDWAGGVGIRRVRYTIDAPGKSQARVGRIGDGHPVVACGQAVFVGYIIAIPIRNPQLDNVVRAIGRRRGAGFERELFLVVTFSIRREQGAKGQGDLRGASGIGLIIVLILNQTNAVGIGWRKKCGRGGIAISILPFVGSFAGRDDFRLKLDGSKIAFAPADLGDFDCDLRNSPSSSQVRRKWSRDLHSGSALQVA